MSKKGKVWEIRVNIPGGGICYGSRKKVRKKRIMKYTFLGNDTERSGNFSLNDTLILLHKGRVGCNTTDVERTKKYIK